MAAPISNPILPSTLSALSGVRFIARLIQTAVNLAFLVGAVFFFFMLLVGAVGWISAGGDKAQLEEAKGRLTNALIGIIVLFSLYAALGIVQNFLGVQLVSFSVYSLAGTFLGDINLSPIGQFSGLSGITAQGLISALISLILVAGAIIFFFMLASGAVMWISSGGDKVALEAAKQRLQHAFIGIVILFSIWALATLVGRFFNVQLLTFNAGSNPPTSAPPPTLTQPTSTPPGGGGTPTPPAGYAWCGDCDTGTCNIYTTSTCTAAGYQSPCTGNCNGYLTPTPRPTRTPTPTPPVAVCQNLSQIGDCATCATCRPYNTVLYWCIKPSAATGVCTTSLPSGYSQSECYTSSCPFATTTPVPPTPTPDVCSQDVVSSCDACIACNQGSAIGWCPSNSICYHGFAQFQCPAPGVIRTCPTPTPQPLAVCTSISIINNNEFKTVFNPGDIFVLVIFFNNNAGAPTQFRFRSSIPAVFNPAPADYTGTAGVGSVSAPGGYGTIPTSGYPANIVVGASILDPTGTTTYSTCPNASVPITP